MARTHRSLSISQLDLGEVVVWQFGGKDVFVGKQLEVAAKSQIGLLEIFSLGDNIS